MEHRQEITAGAGTRERILAAARAEFSRHGKKGARMERIAVRSAANKAMLYYYFSSKDDLYREVLYSFFSEVFGGLSQVLRADGRLEKKIMDLVSMYIDFFAGHSEMIQIMMHELASGGEDISQVLRQKKVVEEPLGITAIRAYFREEIRQGRIRPMDERHLIMSLIGMCIYMFMASPMVTVVLGIRPEDPALREQRKQEICSLILKGIRPEAVSSAGKPDASGKKGV